MLARFCLYGFLKNQRYFEPYFMLALLAHDLSFFGVGLLIACRALTINLLEIPSGAMADAWGRRACMIGSFVAYVISFLLFAFAPTAWLLVPAMILYGIGDSFRTGTHKAMIFEWLRLQGRHNERTRVYGVTRSWSKFGSAVSSVLSAACVLATGDFRGVFLFATIPYVLNIINFMGYPSALDGEHRQTGGNIAPTQFQSLAGSGVGWALRRAWKSAGLRGLIRESMCWEGVYGAVEDYLQPALLLLLLGWLAGSTISDSAISDSAISATAAPTVGDVISMSPSDAAQDPRTVIVIAATYAALALLGGAASRTAFRLVDWSGSSDAAARWLWCLNLALYLGLGICDVLDWRLLVVMSFLALGILQNLWRPIFISRFDDHGDPQWGAMNLSIESQSQRLATLFVAPLVGISIDWTVQNLDFGHFWPIALIGALASLPALFAPNRPSATEQFDDYAGQHHSKPPKLKP